MGATKRTDIEIKESIELSPFEDSAFRENTPALLAKTESMQVEKLELNKGTLNAQIQNIVGSVERGNVNPLEAFIYLNWMQKIADAAKKQLLDEAISEAEKYPEKEAELYDAVVTVKNGAGRYKYPDYIKDLQEQHKAAYKAKKDGNTITNEDGEIIEPAEFTPGRTILNIKFK